VGDQARSDREVDVLVVLQVTDGGFNVSRARQINLSQALLYLALAIRIKCRFVSLERKSKKGVVEVGVKVKGEKRYRAGLQELMMPCCDHLMVVFHNVDALAANVGPRHFSKSSFALCCRCVSSISRPNSLGQISVVPKSLSPVDFQLALKDSAGWSGGGGAISARSTSAAKVAMSLTRL
jgi:hypothetical protein